MTESLRNDKEGIEKLPLNAYISNKVEYPWEICQKQAAQRPKTIMTCV